MEPSDSLTENESSTTLEDFLVKSSSELQYSLQQRITRIVSVRDA